MADSKITALAALTAADPANDMFPVVDVSDTSMAASGTTKRISINNILACSPAATLASATITGALTVGNGTSATQTFSGVTNILDIGYGSLRGGSAYGDVRLWTDRFRIYNNAGTQIIKNISGTNGDETWYDGAGGTRMTLNSTGLGIGTSPVEKLTVAGKGLFVSANPDNSALKLEASTGTNSVAINFLNTGGDYFVGVDNSVGGRLYGVPYSLCIGSTGAYPVVIATNNTARLTVDASGNLILQSSATPATLGTNGMLTVNATSNTNLRFSYRGSDGTTRVANITLA